MTASEWLRYAAEIIPRPEARQILESVLGFSREQLHRAAEDSLTEIEVGQADAKANRRNAGEPLAYVVGKKVFLGREFAIDRNVLIPRPETELLTETVLKLAKKDWTCIDVGTGCGCIGISIALTAKCHCVATDISLPALVIAMTNAKHFGANISFQQSNLLSAIRDRSADLIVSNPPYIANGDPRVDQSVLNWEPQPALFSGQSGLEAISELVHDAARVLKPNGCLAFEFGMGQADDVRDFLRSWSHEIYRDLAGIERFVLAFSTR